MNYIKFVQLALKFHTHFTASNLYNLDIRLDVITGYHSGASVALVT